MYNKVILLLHNINIVMYKTGREIWMKLFFNNIEIFRFYRYEHILKHVKGWCERYLNSSTNE